MINDNADIKGFHRIDGVWITNYEYALHIARTVRFILLKVSAARASASHEDNELKRIYEYITSEAFRHKFEAHFEAVKSLRDDLTTEKRLTEPDGSLDAVNVCGASDLVVGHKGPELEQRYLRQPISRACRPIYVSVFNCLY